MQVFLMIAAAHFLALLSPGPDFFLIARTSLSAGWRAASGACLGIALANGVFIVAAFAGTSALRPGSALFVGLQLAGCVYLLWLGVLFMRHAGGSELQVRATDAAGAAPARPLAAWGRAAGMGFLSGILNPKNALFYASLAAMLSGPYASAGWKLCYGAWMVGVVLAWDTLVALTIGNRAVLRGFTRCLPWLERISGLMLIALALVVLAVLARR
ncbi:LysE family translocator [Burkholderia sp. Ac-20379]|uniref:LysE family translocator n=1 Tax=Burkholderia sp. Ac-20379 TaxID=2703900 RepID=UPI0019821231|nr:LysE family translocator [Burkholderia sp. Ac-20379]MBN3729052.1 LysE family translocator [Burkholderia sp. Ac-20379]